MVLGFNLGDVSVRYEVSVGLVMLRSFFVVFLLLIYLYMHRHRYYYISIVLQL